MSAYRAAVRRALADHAAEQDKAMAEQLGRRIRLHLAGLAAGIPAPTRDEDQR